MVAASRDITSSVTRSLPGTPSGTVPVNVPDGRDPVLFHAYAPAQARS